MNLLELAFILTTIAYSEFFFLGTQKEHIWQKNVQNFPIRTKSRTLATELHSCNFFQRSCLLELLYGASLNYFLCAHTCAHALTQIEENHGVPTISLIHNLHKYLVKHKTLYARFSYRSFLAVFPEPELNFTIKLE